jgi:aminoglycoside phosphotransferase (APT) family kinase protein
VTLPADVVDWVEEVAGGPLQRCDRVPGGARREAWLVDVGDDELFLRYDDRDADDPRDPWTLRREAEVYSALHATDVPVPRVLGVHPTRQAMLEERVSGATWFARIIDPDEQLATARDFIGHLATLHRIDPAALDLPSFPKPESVAEAICLQLDELDAVVAARGGAPDAGLALTLTWLRANVPDHDGPVVLVQGDTGPGNFLYEGGRVTAVLDWELAHLGDPMDDVAWLSLRAAQEPFTHLPDRLREYEILSGIEVDDERVWYHRVLAEAKLLVMAHGAESTGDVGNRLIFGVLHRRLWLEAMVHVLHLAPPAPQLDPPVAEPHAHQALYDEVLDLLRDVVVPAIDDSMAKGQAKGLARSVKYLAAVSTQGTFYDAEELDDAGAILGTTPQSVNEARVAIDDAARAGELTVEQYVTHRWRCVQRENELVRSSSGALADRRWPELR